VLFCMVTAMARSWFPSIGNINHGDTAWIVCRSWLLGFASLLALPLSALCLTCFARACLDHPGRVWYDMGAPQVAPHDAQDNPGLYRQAEDNSPLVASPSAPPATAAAATTGVVPRLAFPANTAHPAPRRCGKCQKPKPGFIHHCSRCQTCIDRMDHHCPWIGQCVGRTNHKFFMLFLLYTALTGLVIVLTGLGNFIDFITDLAEHDENVRHHPPVFINGTAQPPNDPQTFKKDVDLVLVVAWFIAALFTLMLSCFFGAVWQSAGEGETQLDRRPLGYDGRLTQPDQPSTVNLRKYVMGEGSALFWFLPTTPNFAVEDIQVVPITT
jgi:hypothetical protein